MLQHGLFPASRGPFGAELVQQPLLKEEQKVLQQGRVDPRRRRPSSKFAAIIAAVPQPLCECFLEEPPLAADLLRRHVICFHQVQKLGIRYTQIGGGLGQRQDIFDLYCLGFRHGSTLNRGKLQRLSSRALEFRSRALNIATVAEKSLSIMPNPVPPRLRGGWHTY